MGASAEVDGRDMIGHCGMLIHPRQDYAARPMK